MLTGSTLEDRQRLRARLTVLRVAMVVVFLTLAGAFWVFQVLEHDRYEELAENQHQRIVPLRAPRGIVYDRHGTVLVRNTYSFTIAIIRGQSVDLGATLKRLAAAAGVDEARIAEIVANARRRRDPPDLPTPIIEHATMAQVAAVSARQVDLPEVVIQQLPTREYPEGGMAAHLFGYVGQIQEAQLQRAEFAKLETGAVVGQTGVERTYDGLLRGRDGSRIIAVNSRGREVAKLGELEPVDGDRLELTIDADLQKALEDGFAGAGYAGAGVLLDPKNGEVLALTSLPSYDPNAFAGGLDGTTLARLTTDPLKPFTNRVLQGAYSPGSSFKILMAMAALEEGVITPDFTVACPGHFTFGNRRFKCNLPGGRGHGVMDLRHAIEKSCNVYFYTLGSMMKVDTVHAWAEKMGLAGKTGIDLPNERESLVPSTEWATKVRKSPWFPGEMISVAIGQGPVTVTPVGLATMISTVANGGTLVTPHLVKAVDRGTGWVAATSAQPRGQFFVRPDALQAVRDGLWLVVNGEGTGGRAKVDGRDVAGKTGTAQVISNEGKKAAQGRTTRDLRDHGFFVFFAPRDNPEIAGVVFAEHAEHGSNAAAIARHVIATYFAKQAGQPLPVLPPSRAVTGMGPAPAGDATRTGPGDAPAGAARRARGGAGR